MKDITPPTIAKWLQQPIERAHVLLDRKGKTMSHAFVEVRTAEVAGAILRGETSSHGNSRGDIGLSNASAGSQRGRGAVLGRGRRARGVTITRSSQEELMAAVSFDFASTCVLGSGLTHALVVPVMVGHVRWQSPFTCWVGE